MNIEHRGAASVDVDAASALRMQSPAVGLCLRAAATRTCVGVSLGAPREKRCCGGHPVTTKTFATMQIPHTWALNSAVECHLHTVEVTGSNPVAPTIFLEGLRRVFVFRVAPNAPLRAAILAAMREFRPSRSPHGRPRSHHRDLGTITAPSSAIRRVFVNSSGRSVSNCLTIATTTIRKQTDPLLI